jgi:hypothetical protein
MNLYNVSVPRSAESTEWYIVAETAQDAMRLYVDGVVDEILSVDEGEMHETGALDVELVGQDAQGDARVIEWDSAEEIRRVMKPIETAQIQLSDHPDWDRWRAHFEGDFPGL